MENSMFFWATEGLLLIGGLLFMIFGGQKSSGGSGYNFGRNMPSLKQIVGAIMFIFGLGGLIMKLLF